MANSALTLTSLDFNTLKQQFQTYLTSQSVFKDYNFTSASMNVELDVLSYNTYLNAFYLNMVFSEMFMDSAQKLDSTVSHAKDLNYLPQSATSSAANISFSVNTAGIHNPFVIPRGAQFTGSNSNGTYTYVTDAPAVFTSPNNSYTVSNLLIYEGQYVTDSFVVDYTKEQQIFVMSNPNIDVSSLEVTVYENSSNASSNGTVYSVVNTLYNLNGNSQIYFIQAAQAGQYEILFGDGLLGYVPFNGSIVTANYRVASGNTADGITNFSSTQDLGAYNGGTATIVGQINTTSNSVGGASQETIQSIKFNAPRYFATQERAVASDDYAALILAQFSDNIQDVIVYGGELLNPKQYGRVVVCLKPVNNTIAPDYIKNQITTYLLQYIAIPNRTIITDPDYFYCAISSNVSYSSTATTLSAQDIQNEVISSIVKYGSSNLEAFGDDFRYSKFIATIDGADSTIVGNDTSVLLVKRFSPIANVATSYTFNYNNAALVESPSYQLVAPSPGSEPPAVYSSPFTYVDSAGNKYPNAIIRDDNFGNLIVYDVIASAVVQINTTLGTINYETGQIQINNLVAGSYEGDYIALYFNTATQDILVVQNQILVIDINDVVVNMIAV